MKKSKIYLGIAIAAVAGFFVVAADHIDAPAVMGTTSDITDFYAFRGENTNNIVFVANVQGLMSPADTGTASFDENVLVEINIDTNGDAIEDLVIQAIPRDGKMYFFGPVAPSQTGLSSSISLTATPNVVDITTYGGSNSAVIATNSGMSFFAGPRDDPFFFDFTQFNKILDPNDATSSFNNPGDDTFKGSNVMSIVVEVPKAMLGGGASINSWVESKRKQ